MAPTPSHDGDRKLHKMLGPLMIDDAGHEKSFANNKNAMDPSNVACLQGGQMYVVDQFLFDTV